VTNNAAMRARSDGGTPEADLRRALDERVAAEVLGLFERRVPN